jgi:hypothetical protein
MITNEKVFKACFLTAIAFIYRNPVFQAGKKYQ